MDDMVDGRSLARVGSGSSDLFSVCVQYNRHGTFISAVADRLGDQIWTAQAGSTACVSTAQRDGRN